MASLEKTRVGIRHHSNSGIATKRQTTITTTDLLLAALIFAGASSCRMYDDLTPPSFDVEITVTDINGPLSGATVIRMDCPYCGGVVSSSNMRGVAVIKITGDLGVNEPERYTILVFKQNYHPVALILRGMPERHNRGRRVIATARLERDASQAKSLGDKLNIIGTKLNYCQVDQVLYVTGFMGRPMVSVRSVGELSKESVFIATIPNKWKNVSGISFYAGACSSNHPRDGESTNWESVFVTEDFLVGPPAIGSENQRPKWAPQANPPQEHQ